MPTPDGRLTRSGAYAVEGDVIAVRGTRCCRLVTTPWP